MSKHRLYALRRRLTGQAPVRYMYDGLGSNAGAIARKFPNAQMIAGYTDGPISVWSQAEWNLFPHAAHVYITVFASDNFGDVIDCESGDATPASAAAWVRMRKKAGLYRPTIYCNLSTAPAVRIATGNLVLGVDYDLWIADWTGSPHQITFPDGRKAVATQFSSPPGSFYDESVVYDSAWPHRTAPKPPPPSGPHRHVIGKGNDYSFSRWATDLRHESPKTLLAYNKSLVPDTLTEAHYALLASLYSVDLAADMAKVTRCSMEPGTVIYTRNP